MSLGLLLVRARRQPRQRVGGRVRFSICLPISPVLQRLHVRLGLLEGLLVLLGAVAVAEADREDRVLEFPRREIPRRPDPRPIAADVRLELDARVDDVITCVEIKILRRVRAERHRRDACSGK